MGARAERVVLMKGKEATVEEIMEFCRSRLEGFKHTR